MSSTEKAYPTIVIVGPTNVVKSTLFNRLTGTRKAIVCDRPGVTVDRHEQLLKDSPLDGSPVQIVDTGGVGPEALQHPLGKEIERAAKIAVQEADLILFTVDGTREAGLEELEIASWLRAQAKIDNASIWVLANKKDSKKFDDSSYYMLGFDRVLGISAEHDEGIIELWDEIRDNFKARALIKSDKPEEDFSGEEKAQEEEAPAAPRILVLGRPNVGKSTLLNAILGNERHVVSEIPGTTRDTIESTFQHRGHEWSLVDTAGLRRPGRLERGVEWVAREKLKERAREADLAVLLIDSSEGVTDLDAAIGGMAIDFGLSLVVAFNKWDKMRGDDTQDLHQRLSRTSDLKMDFLEWCPKVYLSGLTGRGVSELLKQIEKVLEARGQRAQTSRLNDLFERKLRLHHHPIGPRGKPAKFYYLAQVKTNPPEFVLFSNLPGNAVHFSFKRFITNTLRSEFGFEGTPIKLHFKVARGS